MCVTLTFHYSWVLQPSQEKLKTMLMQNWGEASWGNLGDVRVANAMPVNCNKQEPCYGSTIKISLNPFWVLARMCIVPQIFLDRKRFANIWSWEKRGNEDGSDPDHSTTVNSSQCFSSKESGKITGQRIISRGQIKMAAVEEKKHKHNIWWVHYNEQFCCWLWFWSFWQGALLLNKANDSFMPLNF